jgi:hypothetical protein
MRDAEDIWGHNGILGFPIDCNAVLAHLKQDMRDDWFFDAIKYKDLFANPNNLKETLSKLLLEGNGKYPGEDRVICDIPKKSLGIRYALETDFYDRFVYQAICSFLLPFYDPLLSHRVLSHRFDKNRAEEKYIFKNRIELWKTFEGVTFTAFRENKTLLATDLINYFENITIESIRSAFEEKIPDINANGKEKLQIHNAIATLCELLTRWGYSEKHGLPQNRDASSFIANVVLCKVDHTMRSLKHDYYRYVDDIRIICDSPTHAQSTLIELIKELRKVGMNINGGKTKILTTSSSNSEIAEFFPGGDDRSAAIDNMWRSRSRKVIARSIPLICEIIKECIAKNETQSRQFRFAINRLSQLAEANIFDATSDLSNQLAETLISNLDDHPASADQYRKIFSTIPLTQIQLSAIAEKLSDEKRSFHHWQNYQLWFTLALKKHKDPSLEDVAKKRIFRDPTSAEAPAIFIYLYCTAGSNALSEVIDKFSSNWPYQHKRHFLFAAKDLGQNEMKRLAELLSTRTVGTLIRAKNHFTPEGLPLPPKEHSSLQDLYDNISPYD